jgi:hypothetical protein
MEPQKSSWICQSCSWYNGDSTCNNPSVRRSEPECGGVVHCERYIKLEDKMNEDKLCPWCGGEVVMHQHGSTDVLNPNVIRMSPVMFVPVCKDCTVTDLRVLIDVPTEEEAWKEWANRK